MENIKIIGIAGPSSAGKTTISKILKKLFKKSKIVHIDNYWGKEDTIPKSFEKWREWEKPHHINFKKLYRDLIKLKNKGNYKIIIVEGFHLFYNKKIREILDLKIYLEIKDNLIIKRRIKKFGPKNNQKKYSKEIVLEEYKKYGKPTKKYADLNFNGNEKIENIKNKIIKYSKKQKLL